MDPRNILDPLSIREVFSQLGALGPEIIIIFTLLGVILIDWFLPLKLSFLSGLVAVAGCVMALVTLIGVLVGLSQGQLVQYTQTMQYSQTIFRESLVIDSMSILFKLLFISATLLAIVLTFRYKKMVGLRHGEYYALLLTALLGMCFLASAQDFVMFILALETLSLPSYVLAAFFRDDRRSNEAGIKYLLYGAAATGIMLFGISYIYGMTGTTQLNFLEHPRMIGEAPLIIAVLFILVGLGFKIAAAPFHFWAPDVYQGAPTPITAWLSVASKAAGFAALLRILYPLMGNSTVAYLPELVEGMHLKEIFWLLAVLTMTVGNTAALWQTDLKRLLAYSSIAHAGYLLMGLAVLTGAAINAILVYTLVYFLMNFGAFLVVMLLENRYGSTELKVFKGLIRRNPFLVVAMTFCLLSLTGIPPFAGFVAKIHLFGVVIQEKFIFLALIGVANSVISAWYYMKVVRTMVLDAPEEGAEEFSLPLFDSALVLLLIAPILYFGIFWNSLSRFVDQFVKGISG